MIGDDEDLHLKRYLPLVGVFAWQTVTFTQSKLVQMYPLIPPCQLLHSLVLDKSYEYEVTASLSHSSFWILFSFSLFRKEGEPNNPSHSIWFRQLHFLSILISNYSIIFHLKLFVSNQNWVVSPTGKYWLIVRYSFIYIIRPTA